MATAEAPPAVQLDRAGDGGRAERRWAWPALALVLGGGLALRLWGAKQGLPFVYNIDEADHFVPRAIEMFRHHSLNPHYFANPPAFTYLLHYLYAIAYGGASGAEHAYRAHPQSVYTLARVAGAVLGTLSLWLLYLVGARLFSRAVGVLAAAVEAVAFLPVFYAHLALNDVPTLAPLTLSLLGSAGVLRKGRVRDHALAGVGLGLACASKYTAGVALLPYLAATAASLLAGERAWARTLARIALMALVSLVAFLIANPYALLDYSAFHRELVHQSSQAAEAQGKLGAPQEGGLFYYLWALTWGLGWAPSLAALAGAVAVWWRERALGWMLVPAPILFLAFMGTQGRYFGRWLMPILPLLCLLAAFCVLHVASRILPPGRELDDIDDRQRDPNYLRSRGLVPSALLGSLLIGGLLVQGLAYGVHSATVLARADTRSITREWMIRNIPLGSHVVVEPVSPNDWARASPGAPDCPGFRWCKYPSLYPRIDATTGRLLHEHAHAPIGIENYVRTLAPSLLNYYVDHGWCWVVTGSTQRDRAFAAPRAVPLAVAYYRRLARRGTVAFRASPYGQDARRVKFNFDWSFDYYPMAYRLPGPVMTVYRLHGRRCGR
jgi:Dolichyl-phosphate-mannose-protein mannosyltransferase